jgi:hypothetical protein
MAIVLWYVPSGNIFADPTETAREAKPAKAALLGVPLNFEANQGQADSQVKFLSRGDGYSLFLTSHDAVFTLRPPAGAKALPSIFRRELRGANRGVQVTGADKLSGVANYYVGNDPKEVAQRNRHLWQSQVPGHLPRILPGGERVPTHGEQKANQTILLLLARRRQVSRETLSEADLGRFASAAGGHDAP